MGAASGHTSRGGLGRLLAGGVAFALVAPPALIAAPLAALLALPGPRTARHLVLGGVAGGVALWWLLLPGDPPDQVLRTGAVFSSVTFVLLTVRTRWSFIHRALAAVAVAVASIALLMALVGPSFPEAQWWATHRVGLMSRVLLGAAWGPPGSGADTPAWWPDPASLEAFLGWYTAFVGACFPALSVLQLMGGLAVATAVYHRVATRPVGAPLARLRHFRFSEHLGWAVVIPLAVMVLLHVATVRVAAANFLLVAGVLYGLRGLAVVAFGLYVLGAGGPLLWIVQILMVVLMLPLVAGGAILLGVLDAGLDLRRRWATPPTGR